ncbi:hypothetical protein HDU96_003015 [Phlyctochytrium bullatum]|nr:hypothetical protein HDU96_003015 [Phlyctochytrium bullatum]
MAETAHLTDVATEAVANARPPTIGNDLDTSDDGDFADLFDRAFNSTDVESASNEEDNESHELDLHTPNNSSSEHYRAEFEPFPKQFVDGVGFDFTPRDYERYVYLSRVITMDSMMDWAGVDFLDKCNRRFPPQKDQSKYWACRGVIMNTSRNTYDKPFRIVPIYPRVKITWYVTNKKDCLSPDKVDAIKRWCEWAFGRQDFENRKQWCLKDLDCIRITKECLAASARKYKPPFKATFYPCWR